MALLHLGALYGITLIPSCKVYTCLFGEHLPLSWAGTSDFYLLFDQVASDSRQQPFLLGFRWISWAGNRA